MAESVAGWSFVGRTETRTVFGTASHSLAVTLLLFVLIWFLMERRRKQKFSWDKRTRKTSGNNNVINDEEVAGLEALPGPKAYPLFGSALEMIPLNRTISVLLNWGKVYGPAVKFEGPFNHKVVMLNSGPLVQSLLKSTDMGHLLKMPLAYNILKPFINNGVLVSKGKFWQHERKILMRSQTFQALRAYIPMLNRHCERFVSSLDKLFADGKVHSINELINTSFLEVMAEMITGFDIHHSAEGAEYHHNFQVWKEIATHRLAYGYNLIPSVFKLNPLSRKYDLVVQRLSDFARRRIAEHKKQREEAVLDSGESSKVSPEDEADVNSSKNVSPPFRSVLDELVDAKVSDSQIIEEVNTMLFGGHETGASAIHLFCFAMGLYPEIQETCRKEIDEVFEDPMQVQNGRMTYDSISSLKYVERTLLETLRLYPPPFVYLRELQTPLRIELEGKPIEIPSGTTVCVSPFVLHRQEENFEDPERFDPDRFLPEEVAKRHAYAYAPFSHGPRNCLGLKFAMIEMKMVVAYLLRNFSIETTDEIDDVQFLPNMTLTPERDYNFILKRRELS